MANAVKDDSVNYYLGLALFTLLVPVLFFVSVWLSPTGESIRPRTAEAPAAPAAEAAPAE